MSPIEFAKKLLNLWGCRLVQVFVDDDGNEEGILQRADVVNNSNINRRQTTKPTTVATGKRSPQEKEDKTTTTNTNNVLVGGIQQQQRHYHQLQQQPYLTVPVPLPPLLEGHQLQQLQTFPLPLPLPHALPLPPQPRVALQSRFSTTSEASGNTSDNTATAAFTLTAFGGNPSGNPFGIGMSDGNAAVAAATAAAANTLTGIGDGNGNGNVNAFINTKYNTSYDNALVVGTSSYGQHQTPMKGIRTSPSPQNSASSGGGGGSGKKSLRRPPKKFFGDTADLAVAQNMRLSHPNDSQHLNTLHCFVRTELLEVFALKPGAVNNSSDEHNIVGIRCTQCGTLSKKERGNEKMAVFFPKSVQDLYRGVW
jgi:hypothetical protein